MANCTLLGADGKPIRSSTEHRGDLREHFGSRRIHGKYDAAQDPDELKNYWVNADRFDADSANSKEVRGKLVSRSRYELANNGYADGIVQTYATDLIGTGPRLRMQTTSAGFNQMVEREFYSWSKATKWRRKLWCMAHAKTGDGEGLGVMRLNPRVRHQVKLDVTLYETEQCQTPFPTISDPTYIDGIKSDEFDNPLWYDFLIQHPGKANGMSFSLKAMRVEAGRVLHWFKMRRPGQHRGVPECSSTLNLGAMFRRLREANVSTAEKVAEWTLFLKSAFPPEVLDAIEPSTFELLRGLMTMLPNSVEPFQLKAEHPGPTYDEFHSSLLNEQARPLNMPANKAACDSSDYNYASGRLDHQTYYAALDVEREDCNELVLEPLFDQWFDIAIDRFGWLGGRPSLVGFGARQHTWDWPKHRVADVEAEANAIRTKLESAQTFPHLVYTDAGLDFEDEVEKAASTFGVSTDEVRRRLFDVLLPPPKQLPKPADSSATRSAVAAIEKRMNGHGPPPAVNGHGGHHAN